MLQFFVMIDTVLVPAKTVVSAKGDGPCVDISAATGRIFLLILNVTRIIEQESIDVSVLASADGTTWDPKSAAAFRQEFYCGEYPLLLDLSDRPDVKFLRTHWEVALGTRHGDADVRVRLNVEGNSREHLAKSPGGS